MRANVFNGLVSVASVVYFAKKMGRYALFSIAGAVVIILLAVGWFYASCPVYKFEEPKPFAGEKFYNPYQGVDSAGWLKSIFHLHAKSWGGLTDGGGSVEETFSAYRRLGFDVTALSNYMSIDATNSNSQLYIPAYEHGYGVKMIHQLALGARKVVWRDYVVLQNLNQKQSIVDIMKKYSRYVAICHPSVRKAYMPADLKYLSGYDFLEVLSGWRGAFDKEWDAALSNGHQVWLIANDDAHSVDKPSRLQREVTYVNASIRSSDEVLKRLAQGAAFGVRFPRSDQTTFEEKVLKGGTVSFPASIETNGDTLFVVWRQKMERFEFVGDGGALLKTVEDTCTAFYPIRSEDTYVRVKLTSPEGLVYYLNPIIRYSGDKPIKQTLHSVDKKRTFFKRGIIIIAILFVIIVVRRLVGGRSPLKRF